MTSCQGNVISEVLKCIELCEQNNASMLHVAGDSEKIRAVALEMINEMEQRLCRLTAIFLTAPISGRLFTPLPHENILEQHIQESLEAQMH
jgi:hypothetical protein